MSTITFQRPNILGHHWIPYFHNYFSELVSAFSKDFFILLVDVTKEEYRFSLKFPCCEYITQFSPRVDGKVFQCLKPCPDGPLEGQYKQRAFQLTFGIMIIEHSVHMFHMFVLVSSFIIVFLLWWLL